MMPQLIDRKSFKQEMRELLRTAQVSPRGMTALYLLILLALDMICVFCDGPGLLPTFVSILSSLIGMVLGAGFILYCMAVRRNERAEYLTLFDGFSFVGKLIGLQLLIILFVGLWAMLFIIPGIIAAYRYRFALFNLCENPDISILEALNMSRRQTLGYKSQLLMLDLSYLGWGLLAGLPSLLQDFLVYRAFSLSILLGTPDFSILTASPLMPAWAWTLIGGLWMLAVSMFYLAHYRCMELAYFDTAKATSGVGDSAVPPTDNWHNGPDGLGGL